ncbi:MAG: immune inhibitor A domain-containing protein [Acidimicrobiia bacterium]
MVRRAVGRRHDADQIAAYVKQFDIWDRYDWDGDGNFDEPDGYIDHMQAVHAGVGEETGGGLQGEDAIWSYRWYTFFGLIGVVGPSNGPLFGGFEIGDTDVWVGDYTIQPENGGLGVFAHEYAHDLGLPDAYDTAGGENGLDSGQSCLLVPTWVQDAKTLAHVQVDSMHGSCSSSGGCLTTSPSPERPLLTA